MGKLSARDLLKVCARMVLLQSVWNEGTMQSEGFAYCVAPTLGKIHEDDEKLRDSLKHLKAPFNTHPFLAGVLAGAVLKMEEEGRSPRKIASYLKKTMGPLAALGDPFFKTGLAPATTLIAAATAVLVGPIAAMITLLLLFNGIHLAIRIGGVFAGYRHGGAVMAVVAKWISPTRTRVLKSVSAAIGGGLPVLLATVYRPPALDPYSVEICAGAALLATGVAFVLTGKRYIWVFVTPVLLGAAILLEIFL